MPGRQYGSKMRCSLTASVALALLVAFGVAHAKPDPDPFGQRLTGLRNELARQQAELARWAFAQDLFREYGNLAREVLRYRPHDGIGGLEAKLKKLDQASFTRRYRNAVRKSSRAFQRRLYRMSKPMAKRLVALAKEADKAGDSEVAESCFLFAYRVDSRNKDASRALRKRDYDLIFNYGALPKPEKEAARKILERLGGNFLREKDLENELETWTDAWGLKTRNYRFVTNAPHMTVFQFAECCEDLHDAWEQIMRESEIKVRKLRKRVSVWFFDSPITFQTILRTLDWNPPNGVLGYYSPVQKIGFFYDDPGFYRGNVQKLFETFWHEGTHQLLHEVAFPAKLDPGGYLCVKAPDKGDSAKYPMPWIEEGFCLYMELLQIRHRNGKRSFTFGQVIDDDLARGLRALKGGKLIPVERFVHMTRKAWNAYELGYSHAALLMHYLMEGDRRRYRKQVFTLLARQITQGGLRKQTMFEMLGVKPDELTRAYTAHARRIVAELPFRQYERKDN